MRRRLTAALGCVLLVSGCAAVSDVPRPAKNVPGLSLSRERPSPSPVPSARPGPTIVVEPWTGDGSQVQIGGLKFDAPAGWSVERVDDESAEIRQLRPEGTDRPLVFVTTQKIAGGGDAFVDGTIDLVVEQWEHQGQAREVTISWAKMPHARGLLVTAEATGQGLWDILVVVTYDRRETAAAMIEVMAPAGTLQESVAFDVLRSARWAS